MRNGARPSGGDIPKPRPIPTLAEAHALLAGMHNWSAKMTRDGDGVRYTVEIRQGGKRASGSGGDFIAALLRCMDKLNGRKTEKAATVPMLKLTH